MSTEISKKYIMWKKELERQNASLGVMHVFDSMMNELGELHRENEELKRK